MILGMRTATLRRVSGRTIATLAALALVVSGCQETTFTVDAPEPIIVPMPTVDPAAWDARGSVISDEPLNVRSEVTDQASEVRHATYRSVSGITGQGTEVSGSFFIPKGSPPAGGWRVIGVAHGFTGATTDCAPSSTPELSQYYGLIAGLLSGGFAVAMTDYEGLGGPGAHPFLEPRTAGFNVTDSIRALRTLFPDTSPRWVAFGISQGGQASWSANEQNEFYGGGMELVGATAVAPAANVAGLAQLSFHEALSSDQVLIMPSFVVGAQTSYPPVPVDKLLHGVAVTQTKAVLGCSTEADKVRAQMTAADVKPDTEADATVLETAARKMSLPTRPLAAPLYVLNGADDKLVLPTWVATSVSRACALGGQIEHHEIAGQGHSIAPDAALAAWVNDRFAGKPASTTCPSSP